VTLPSPAPEQVSALRRMKLVAASLLLAAAAVFVVCVTVGDGRGAWGYVQATAEASMVGGLADWFAVTALFRHPLGIPIPHTAIVARKKDQIGQALANFVEQNFLTAAVVGERLAGLQIPRRAGEWLAEPAHAARLAEELGAALNRAAGLLGDDELRIAVTGYLDRRLHEARLAPALARAIDAICDSGQHQLALSSGLRGLMRFLDENRSVFRTRLAEESPEWVPNWVDERVFTRAFTAVQDFLADVLGNDQHELRLQFDRRLREYAHELRTDPAVAAQAEQTKVRLLDHPDVHRWLNLAWTQAKASVMASSADPRSDLQRTVASLAVQLGDALRKDTELSHRADNWIRSVTTYVLDRYAVEFAAIISSTVERWDAVDMGRRIEVQVGRDLQFIRVNGTVVGALVGLAIYTVSRFL
jgi:uncharacterized membrane-anchored protein YjiN (DUF445 family)